MALTKHDINLGLFLGKRFLLRSNKWTTLLIIFIMALTFLNMVVVSGILVGLIEGGNIANRNQYTGDLLLTRKSGKTEISRTDEILSLITNNPGTNLVATRYISGGTIEANRLSRNDFNKAADTVGTQITGIDPVSENEATKIANYVVEGSYFAPGRGGQILLGSNLIKKYNSGFGDGFDSLDAVAPGDVVRVTVGDKSALFKVVGIVKSKVGEVSMRAFITNSDYRTMVSNFNGNASEVTVMMKNEESAKQLQNLLKKEYESDAKIQTAREAIPDFLNQIKLAFGILGSIIGFVGLVVAATTIFIVIFIQAVTRKKYLGILKGIGVRTNALQIAYIVQAACYAILGGIIASVVIYGLLVPAFNAHPLNFPFSDGILSAPASGTARKFLLLFVVSLLAGYIPAWLVVKKPALQSIRGN